ncbi:hypothetical protein TNCV_473311 [Trichonephila clavipes]|nr:hypothetical protein TNCV_473311 [Trichonephila clavipes]
MEKSEHNRMPTHMEFRLVRVLHQKECEKPPCTSPKRHKCRMSMAELGFRGMKKYRSKNCELLYLSKANRLFQTSYSTASLEDTG